jgi:hypothetical protein
MLHLIHKVNVMTLLESGDCSLENTTVDGQRTEG